MPLGIVAYALMLFSWTTFLETAVYREFKTLLEGLNGVMAFTANG